MALNTALIQESKAKREALMKKSSAPSSLVQQAAVNRAAIMAGQLTPEQQAANRENFAKQALQSSTTINRFSASTPSQVEAQKAINTQYNLPADTGLKINAPKTLPSQPSISRATVLNDQTQSKPVLGTGNWINTSTQAGKKQLLNELAANRPTSAATSGKAFQNATANYQAGVAKPQGQTPTDFLKSAQNLEDYNTSTYETSPYTDEVNRVSKVYSDAEQEQVKATQDYIAELEAAKGTVLDPLTELANQRKLDLREQTAQRLLEARQQASAAKEDQANRFAFSGFGRSSEHADAQAVLAAKAIGIENEINRAALLEEAKIDAELGNATTEQLKSINEAISAQKQKIAGLKSDYAAKQGELRLKAIETGQTIAAKEQARLAENSKQVSDNIKYLMEQAGSGFLQNMSDEEVQGVANSMGVPASALRKLGPTFKQQQQDWDKLKYANDFQWEQQKFYQGQDFELQKLAQQQGFDWQKMQAAQNFDIQKMLMGDELDAAKEYRKNIGLASYGTYAANASGSNGSAYMYQTPVPHVSANTPVVAYNPKISTAYPDGFKFKSSNGSLAGQCAYFAEQLTSLAGKNWTIGNTLQEKKTNLASKVKTGQAYYPGQEQIQVGQTILTNDSKQFGHAAVVNAITPDGKLVLTESNFAGPLTVSNSRTISSNDPRIFGVLKTTPKAPFQVDKAVGGAVAGAISGAKAGYNAGSTATGLLGGLAGALGGAIQGMYSKPQEMNRAALLSDQPAFAQPAEQFSPERQAIRAGAMSLPADRVTALMQYNPQAYQQYMEDLSYSKQNKQNSIAPDQQFRMEQALSDDFNKLSGDYVKIRDAYNKIQSAAQNPSAAGDLSLIFGYMKLLDPNSVVREGEFATAQNAAGVPEQILNIYNRARTGERLNPSQRNDFLTQSQNVYSTQLSSYSQLKQQFQDRAKLYGLNPDRVTFDFSSGGFQQPQTQTTFSSNSDPMGLGI